MSSLGFHGGKSLFLKEKVRPGHICGAYLSDLVAHLAQTSATWPLLGVF